MQHSLNRIFPSKVSTWLAAILIVFLLALPASPAQAAQIDIAGPLGSGQFGGGVTILPNGNFVVVDIGYDEGGVNDIGAVYLYNSADLSLISTLKGSTLSDNVGNGGITVLSNGNYVLRSNDWDNPSPLLTNVGAVTWCSGTSGCSGTVSASNSLIGSTASDNVGSFGITVLSNGNYVARSTLWDNPSGMVSNVGAVTWCSGTSGCSGAVSASNSLIGSTVNDAVGNSGITVLSNGNYVLRSSNWDNPSGMVVNVGAVTWCSGTSGCSGAVSASNSLIGSTASDQVGSNGITALSNGNYVVRSNNWDNPSGSVVNAGAVTSGDGAVGTSGVVSTANSVLGTAPSDISTFTFDAVRSRLLVGRGASNVVSIFPYSTLAEIEVQGNSLAIANGDNTPNTSDSSDFGNAVASGGLVIHTFSISNTGNSVLTLGANAVSLSGAGSSHFSVSSQPATTVAANSSTAFTLTFAPTASGTFTATVAIANDNADENPYSFAIQGTGNAKVNSSFAGAILSKTYLAVPDVIYPGYPAFGITTLTTTFTNTSASTVTAVYFQVSNLSSGKYLLDASGAPGGMDATQALTDSLGSGAAAQAILRIGHALVKGNFAFKVDVWGQVVVAAAEQSAQPIYLGSFEVYVIVDDEVPTGAQNWLFLPSVMR